MGRRNSTSAANGGSILAQMTRRGSEARTSRERIGESGNELMTSGGPSLTDLANLIQASGERTRAEMRQEVERAVRNLEGNLNLKLKQMQKDINDLLGTTRQLKLSVNPNWLGNAAGMG